MKCFFCKRYIPKRESYYTAGFTTRSGLYRRLRWCLDCNRNRRSDIDKEYDRRQKIEEEHRERWFIL